MIRQAISCDICGAEKRQTNHWFIACEQAGELRVGGWASRNRLRSGTKHLCGQTCLHKLVDEFMARTIADRAAVPAAEQPGPDSAQTAIDTSLTSPAAWAEADSSARLMAPATDDSPAQLSGTAIARAAAIVPMPVRPLIASPAAIAAPLPAEEPPAYSSRRWRAEAWERERNRELRATEHHPEILRRRKEL